MFQNGQIIGRRFRILRPLGAGGMGHVYKAHDENLGREVAIKLLADHAVQDQTVIDRFFHEGRVLAAIKHPAVIDIYSFETDEQLGIPFFVMEYVDGSLFSELKPTLLHDRTRLASYLLQLCEGIQACHERGVIHRDLKPTNILVDQRGRLKLFDFGIAKTTLQQTQVGQTLGTPYYMSPEQCMGSRELSPKSDMYSLGVIFWEFLFGQVPFDAAPHAGAEVAIAVQHIQATLPQVAIDPHDPLLPLVPLVRRMLDKDPASRPEVAEIITALQGFLGTKAGVIRNASVSVPAAQASGSTLSTGEKLAASAFALFVLFTMCFGLYDRYNPSADTPAETLTASGTPPLSLSQTASDATTTAIAPPLASSALVSTTASATVPITVTETP
ncbi:MAG TPA: serine/threonine-protein kinase, partial [Candidatus Ozemobacteraceae bacterium]|nr:serine/threonine-protein kinase [Candidatus Ozemobacteraceae bacterium]